jgi:hypothetical protein
VIDWIKTKIFIEKSVPIPLYLTIKPTLTVQGLSLGLYDDASVSDNLIYGTPYQYFVLVVKKHCSNICSQLKPQL